MFYIEFYKRSKCPSLLLKNAVKRKIRVIKWKLETNCNLTCLIRIVISSLCLSVS